MAAGAWKMYGADPVAGTVTLTAALAHGYDAACYVARVHY